MTGTRTVGSVRLAGLQVRCTDGTVVRFVDPPDDGEVGMREPCRPKPPVLPGSAALEVPPVEVASSAAKTGVRS